MGETLTIGGHEIELGNLDKSYFGERGITKGDLIVYYRSVAPLMLPHLRDRALTLQRFPDGIEEDGFIQKSAAAFYPRWIRRARVDKEDGSIEQVVCGDEATLTYLANLGTIVFHAPLSRIDRMDRPDQMIFDLDPSGDYSDGVRRVALALKSLLDELALASLVKTTGSRGFHVLVPIERRYGFDDVRALARRIAETIVEMMPDMTTVAQRKAAREGRIFIDTLRNGYAQTAVAPYSVRARPEAPVAAPLAWPELDDPSMRPGRFTVTNIGKRLRQVGDPWATIPGGPNRLERACRRLGMS